MKIRRVVCGFCILLVSLITICVPTAVLAQEEPEEDLLTITTTVLPFGMVGEAYSATLEATDGTTPYTWSVSKGSLPAGLTLNPATGEISGTPTEDGTANITIKVTDSTTPPQEATQELSVRVDPEPRIVIKADFPKMESIAGILGGQLEYDVELVYEHRGGEDRYFDLVVTAPEGWTVDMTPQFEREKKISGITLEPTFAVGKTIKLKAVSPIWPLPEPGDYKITLEAISDELKGSLELTAVITAMYNMDIVTETERLNTTATAGKDNFFSIEILNLGTDAIENINFSSTKPSGWTIEFTPDKIESLSALNSQTVDVNIQPPTETIAGDYMITLRASGEQASKSIDVRVTVETPTIWGWVGVGIIVLVIAGLAYIFMRFSRR